MTTDEIQAEIERRGTHPQVGPYGEGHDIQQNAWEFARFAAAMQELGVQTVLEIGTGPNAGLARFMHEYLHWTVTSVDKYGCWVKWDGIEFIVSDDRIDFGERRFDLLIIDGNHAYDFVKGDHEHYGKYATKAIMFHDICGLRGCADVALYWGEIASDNGQVIRQVGYHEIIADSEQRVGIGWVEVGKVAIFEGITGIREGFVTSIPVDKPKRKPAAKSKQKPSARKKAAK